MSLAVGQFDAISEPPQQLRVLQVSSQRNDRLINQHRKFVLGRRQEHKEQNKYTGRGTSAKAIDKLVQLWAKIATEVAVRVG